LLLAVFVAGLVAVCMSSGAARTGSAAGGDLTYLACVQAAGQPTQGCGASANLATSTGVAVSPDGQNVYVAGLMSAAIEVFARAADGTLAERGCLGDSKDGPANCTGVADLEQPFRLTVSPDGRNLYAVGVDTLDIISRASSGALTSMGCIETFSQLRPAGQPHCPATANLGGAAAVVVSPDGNNVYVASSSSEAVEIFNRASSGALTAAGCDGNDPGGPANCGKMSGLNRPQSLAISPDGKSLYVGSEDAIAIFDRDANGVIHPDGCVRDIGRGPASCLTQAHVGDVRSLAMSPDGKTLYAGSTQEDAVEVFARASGGGLTEVGCVGNLGTGPKDCTGVTGLNAPLAVAVSTDPGGKSAYVASAFGLIGFSTGVNGMLTPSGCVVSDAGSSSGACAAASGLKRGDDIAVSPGPGASSVYVAAATPGAVVEFARSPLTAPVTTSTAATTTTATPTTATSTTTTKAVPVSVVYATALRNKAGKLSLAIRFKSGEPLSAKVQLAGTKGRVVGSWAFALKAGTHTVTASLPASTPAGPRRLTIVLTDAAKHTKTITSFVVVPKP
jgi:DNA-binding beta-propeller fold protein YncE